ncbi:LEPR-XLL domain-containing protein [uncultured Phascolarctobacterium sp.]|uniref:LEPR-XLL domain-containing protein n=1 Tax=uncultured Phascolarctobacterium sp. TaxID=512296 RepID=UPI00341248A6
MTTAPGTSPFFTKPFGEATPEFVNVTASPKSNTIEPSAPIERLEPKVLLSTDFMPQIRLLLPLYEAAKLCGE